ncbi:unnamed protein product, partial [Prorocentrum cordatum]
MRTSSPCPGSRFKTLGQNALQDKAWTNFQDRLADIAHWFSGLRVESTALAVGVACYPTVSEDEFKKFQCIPDARKALCQILSVDTDDEIQDRMDKLVHTLFRTPAGSTASWAACKPDDDGLEAGDGCDSQPSSLLSASVRSRNAGSTSSRMEKGLEFDGFVER